MSEVTLERIERLPKRAQCLFAVACLERSIPAYEARMGQIWDLPHNAALLGWRCLDGEEIVAERWMRMRAFCERHMASIENYGPLHLTRNLVLASAKLICEMFGFETSGSLKTDVRERARRAFSVANNTIDAVDAMVREASSLDSNLSFPVAPTVERRWQVQALDRLESTLGDGALSVRSLFDTVGEADSEIRGGLDARQAAWFVWTPAVPPNGVDATSYVATMTKEPKVAYHIWEASNSLSSRGDQLLGGEVALVRECVSHEGLARFSYHVLDESLRGDVPYLVYHLLAAEFLRHGFDHNPEMMIRDLDTKTILRFPYPPHHFAEEDGE